MKEPKTYTLFDERSGKALARFKCSEEQVAKNVRSGQVAREGAFDLYATRLGEDGVPAPYQPPQPDADHEWNEGTSRWQKSGAALQRESVQRQIKEIERQQTPRMLREAALGDAEAVARLRALDQEIAALRPEIRPVVTGGRGTTSP